MQPFGLGSWEGVDTSAAYLRPTGFKAERTSVPYHRQRTHVTSASKPINRHVDACRKEIEFRGEVEAGPTWLLRLETGVFGQDPVAQRVASTDRLEPGDRSAKQ